MRKSLVFEGTVLVTIKLCKADLASKVINEKEYAYLQGKMGSIYAKHHGISDTVATGIYEHYLPKFNGDALPSNLEGAIASITDRVDTLVGCFTIGMIPTGSQDPFALRRAAFGIVNIIRGFKMDASLSSLVECSLSLYEKQGVALVFSHSEIVLKVLEYLKQRVVNVLASEYTEKIVKACVSISSDNLLDLISRIEAVEFSKKSGKFDAVEAMIKRIENILKKAKFSAFKIDTTLFEVVAEKALYELYSSEKDAIERAISQNNYVVAIEHLERFADPVSNYFENVMINAEDVKVRENRLLMLTVVDQLFNRLVDVKELA
ncbi:MAG: glycine--tRNA ligase subunit beta [Fusobacteria bacterium]|nr:glycine--tRNA ligase subunit beta [Fusobacteriota bacterium]